MHGSNCFNLVDNIRSNFSSIPIPGSALIQSRSGRAIFRRSPIFFHLYLAPHRASWTWAKSLILNCEWGSYTIDNIQNYLWLHNSFILITYLPTLPDFPGKSRKIAIPPVYRKNCQNSRILAEVAQTAFCVSDDHIPAARVPARSRRTRKFVSCSPLRRLWCLCIHNVMLVTVAPYCCLMTQQ